MGKGIHLALRTDWVERSTVMTSNTTPDVQQPRETEKTWFDKIIEAGIVLLPKPFGSMIQELFKVLGSKNLKRFLVAFAFVLASPVLSVWAMQIFKPLLPKPQAEQLQTWVNSTIHEGYGIDAVAQRLQREATDKAIHSVNANNSSLDYIQLVEFYMEREDVEKPVPVHLKVNQNAVITVHQVIPTPMPGQNCPMPDWPPSQEILVIHLDSMPIFKLGKMTQAGSSGKLALTKEWWAAKESVAKAHAHNGVFDAVRFTKTTEFEKNMTACMRLRVLADIAVHKIDLPPVVVKP
jgi:hypothetical protein